MLLQFAPKQPNHVLEAAGQTLVAGDVFEGPESLLASDSIVAAEPGSVETPIVADVDEEKTPDKPDPSHSPDRAQRDTRPATPRSED